MAGESMLTGTSRMFLWTVPDHPTGAQNHLSDPLPNLRQQRLNSLLLNSLHGGSSISERELAALQRENDTLTRRLKHVEAVSLRQPSTGQ